MKAKRNRKTGGFTLIEMLVVVVIIIALMGIVFKLTGRASEAANRAATVKTLERLKAAVEEFHTVYGTYPPCSGCAYEDFMANGCAPGILSEVLKELDGTRRYGLVAYLKGTSSIDVGMGDDDKIKKMTDEDEEFVRRIKPYVKGLDVQDIVPRETKSGKAYTNFVVTYLDGWGREIFYESKAPYVTYELYSAGPDRNPKTQEDNVEGGLDL